MLKLDLEFLGITKEELQQRVIDQICDTLLRNQHEDNDGRSFYGDSQFKRDLDKQILARINETVSAIAEKHVLPNVAEYVENLTIQQTSEWGEKRGSPVTFIEYLTGRAQTYMQEKVDSSGNTKAESGSSYFNANQTRITFLVEKHIQRSIETAMKDAMKIATGEIAKGIHETCRIKLNEIAANLKVGVSVK